MSRDKQYVRRVRLANVLGAVGGVFLGMAGFLAAVVALPEPGWALGFLVAASIGGFAAGVGIAHMLRERWQVLAAHEWLWRHDTDCTVFDLSRNYDLLSKPHILVLGECTCEPKGPVPDWVWK